MSTYRKRDALKLGETSVWETRGGDDDDSGDSQYDTYDYITGERTSLGARPVWDVETGGDDDDDGDASRYDTYDW